MSVKIFIGLQNVVMIGKKSQKIGLGQNIKQRLSEKEENRFGLITSEISFVFYNKKVPWFCGSLDYAT